MFHFQKGADKCICTPHKMCLEAGASAYDLLWAQTTQKQVIPIHVYVTTPLKQKMSVYFTVYSFFLMFILNQKNNKNLTLKKFNY